MKLHALSQPTPSLRLNNAAAVNGPRVPNNTPPLKHHAEARSGNSSFITAMLLLVVGTALGGLIASNDGARQSMQGVVNKIGEAFNLTPVHQNEDSNPKAAPKDAVKLPKTIAASEISEDIQAKADAIPKADVPAYLHALSDRYTALKTPAPVASSNPKQPDAAADS